MTTEPPPPSAPSGSERPEAQQGLDVRSVPDVVERLKAIQLAANQREPRLAWDGVACFNSLYTTITEAVLAQIEGAGFADTPFIEKLDVIFAKRYFSALAGTPAAAPDCWAVLREYREDPSISPLHFAVAGVNAHVNFDLPFALVAACGPGVPLDANAHIAHQQINKIFADHMRELEKRFTGPVGLELLEHEIVADAAARAGDVAVVLDRDIAWEHAEKLSKLSVAELNHYTLGLDKLVSLASRGILHSRAAT
jgi:hypothetical protein